MSKEKRKDYVIAGFMFFFTGVYSGLSAFVHLKRTTDDRSLVEYGFVPRDTSDAGLSFYHHHCAIFWIFGTFASFIGLLGAMCQSPRFGLYFFWAVIGILWDICFIGHAIATFDRSEQYMGIISKFVSIYLAIWTGCFIISVLIDLPDEKQKEDETKKSTENGGKKFIRLNNIALAEV